MAASGALSLSLEYFRQSLAQSTTFQTWCGASGAHAIEQAANRVHEDSLGQPVSADGEWSLEELDDLRPYVLIWDGGSVWTRRVADASSPPGTDATIMARFVWDVPKRIENDPAQLGEEVRNFIGDLVSDVFALANTAGCLNVQQIEMAEPWTRSDPVHVDKEGDTISMLWQIKWSGV